jgi:hypothetical protein
VEGSDVKVLRRLRVKSVNIDGPPVIGEGGCRVGLYYRHLGWTWGRVSEIIMCVRGALYILETEIELELRPGRNTWTAIRVEKIRLRET